MKYYNPHICLSLGKIDYKTAASTVKESVLCEIRFDLLNFSNDEYSELFRLGKNIIATCRSKDVAEIENRLRFALEQGCYAIDIDVSLPPRLKSQLISLAKQKERKIILSYHNFDGTPKPETLKSLCDEMLKSGPDYIKIATMGQCPFDLVNLISLYQYHQPLIAFAMGEMGKATRLLAPILGAPFTYASLEEYGTAPGQLNYETVDQFLQTYFINP
ncbi:MAG TPA: type I 3-dehydroquinate dehydratase [Salinivirgaceae bacterium]|nr:type I 3-dehydroquinate dehydratase [Salinivirgaceae bacterium]